MRFDACVVLVFGVLGFQLAQEHLQVRVQQDRRPALAVSGVESVMWQLLTK